MKFFHSFVWVGLLAGAASFSLAGCSKTESLGTGEEENKDASGNPEGAGGDTIDGSGGQNSKGTGGQDAKGTGGARDGTGGARNGTGGADHGNGGTHGGDGGANGAGGRATDCSVVDCAPPNCAGGEVLIQDDEHCCGLCVPLSSITHASCIIGGLRYAHLAVIERHGSASCLCVDGHIGRCTGAIPEHDAGPYPPDLGLPPCADGEQLIEACAECGPTDACTAFEFKCRKVGVCDPTNGPQCGAEVPCVKTSCAEGAMLCG